MIAVQTGIFAVPLGEGTVLTIREENTYIRLFTFQNLNVGVLSFKIQYSADGGTTWNTVGSSFNVNPAPNNLEVVAIPATTTNILRIRGSGGAAGNDVEISFARVEAVGTTWISPNI